MSNAEEKGRLEKVIEDLQKQPKPLDDYYRQCEIERDAKRAATARKADRLKIALAVYRDGVVAAHKPPWDQEQPIDFKALACCAVEAADALLVALDPSGIPPFPDYQG